MKVSDGVKRILQEDIYFYALLLILISVLSFGLGRMSVLQEQKAMAPVSAIELRTENVAAAVVSTEEIQKYVVSKNGTKYHLVTCSSASSIKDENKIFFSTKKEAEQNGYTPAANCKGI